MATKSVGVNITVADSASAVGQAGASGGTFTIQILNRAADSAASIDLGVSASGTAFENARKILEGESLSAGNQMTYGPVVLEANEYVIGSSNITNVNFLMMGHDV